MYKPSKAGMKKIETTGKILSFGYTAKYDKMNENGHSFGKFINGKFHFLLYIMDLFVLIKPILF